MHFAAKVLSKERVVIPSVVAVEYIKVAGRRVGRAVAVTRLNLWLNSGAEFAPLSRVDAVAAGELSLRHPNVPMADAVIAAIAMSMHARIVSDDTHYDELGVRRVWYK